MPKKICISAYNIHQGGGKVVLLAFLKHIIVTENYYTCLVDKRLEIDYKNFPQVHFIKILPDLKNRYAAELWLKKNESQFSQFYFIGNLPPLFNLKGKVILFIQNRLLLTPPYVRFSSLNSFLKSFLEILWFRLFLKNVDEIEVQTPSMATQLSNFIKSKPTRIQNYVDIDELVAMRKRFESLELKKVLRRYIYIASEEPHKNIERLIRAFAKISPEHYELFLNLSEESKLYALSKKLNVHVKCITNTNREEVMRLIYTSEYLIFPSLVESLGLPLIEARELGTKIIASKRDFVFDVCTPEETFDPMDIDSITESIKKTISSL